MNINKKLVLKKNLINSRKKLLQKNNRYIIIKYTRNTLVYQKKIESRIYTESIYVPNKLPDTQSWLWCPIIYDAISLIVGKKIIEVTWKNIDFEDYKNNLQETGLTSNYTVIIDRIKNYLLKSLKYNNDDQFITGFLDKYCINQEWYHPSGNDQELILNDSNTISECEILAYLIINN